MDGKFGLVRCGLARYRAAQADTGVEEKAWKGSGTCPLHSGTLGPAVGSARELAATCHERIDRVSSQGE